ncbi:hypothetical protein lerEdw1_007499 [Lerista edwardsae]|nr:hypothetical protein lerEdw1_007499 [Lerista edwardsae]
MGSRTNGVRRRASAGYRLPAPSLVGDFTSTSSPPISSSQSARTPTATQSSAKTGSKIWEDEQKALKGDQVQQDKVWREFVEAEKRATKYWYQNWNFLKDYDPLGKKKEHEQLPDYVSIFSDKIPNTNSHIIGSRLNTDFGKTLVKMDYFLYCGRRKKKLGQELQPS